MEHPTVYPRGVKCADGIAYEYTRTRSPAMTTLANAVKAAYCVGDNHTTLLAPSGMCAIGVALTARVVDKENPVILHGSVLYCDVDRTLAWLTKSFPGARAIAFDVTDTPALEALVAEHRDSVTAVYVESAANPTGDMLDWDVIARVKQVAPHACIIVDNTWLSPAVFNPFSHGADVVVESGTKYLSGGRHVWGHVTAHNAYAPSMIEYVCTFGIRLAPQIAEAVVPLLHALEARVAQSSATTVRVLEALKGHPRVNRVVHPSLPDHPSHRQACALRYPPSVMHLHVAFPSKSAAIKWAKRGSILYCTSFGKAETMLNPWPVWGRAHGDTGPLGMWFRLAIGYDGNCEEVTRAFQQLE